MGVFFTYFSRLVDTSENGACARARLSGVATGAAPLIMYGGGGGGGAISPRRTVSVDSTVISLLLASPAEKVTGTERPLHPFYSLLLSLSVCRRLFPVSRRRSCLPRLSFPPTSRSPHPRRRTHPALSPQHAFPHTLSTSIPPTSCGLRETNTQTHTHTRRPIRTSLGVCFVLSAAARTRAPDAPRSPDSTFSSSSTEKGEVESEFELFLPF